MRTPIVAGNWKMNMTIDQASKLLKELECLDVVKGVEKVLCPPFTALANVKSAIQGTSFQLGAQNAHWESKGAFTGEVSPEMLAELCTYVIIGHSERRMLFGETDDTVKRKVKACLNYSLKPIICVGETLQENQNGLTAEVVQRQVKAALDGLSSEVVAGLVIAYEPVWAIGTGLPATGEGANAVIAEHIRAPVESVFGSLAARSIRVQYGGSVKAENALEFFSQPEIDGALVGGASLKAQEFIGIVKAAQK